MQIRLRLNWCKGKECSLCVNFCPKGVLGMDEDLGKVYIKDINKCVECGFCNWVCPDFVISFVDDRVSK